MISRSHPAERQHAPPAWKFCAAQRHRKARAREEPSPKGPRPGGPDQKARVFSARKSLPELGLEQQNRCRNTRSAKRAPGRNRARDRPLQRRTRDHRATSPAAGPRRAHGSAAAKRARPRKRASLARGKICDFGPELGFEQRNRFRSLRDTCRTEKKVLRKPPAGGPVVGQTFKYIY